MEEDKSLEVMANLSSSHIQGFYDYIMDLEKIIENGGKDNVKPALKYIENNKNLSYILSKLEKRLDSTDINWKNLLKDEGDRRHISENLNNRLHVNLFKLKKHIKIFIESIIWREIKFCMKALEKCQRLMFVMKEHFRNKNQRIY